jgi:hypothetical protein
MQYIVLINMPKPIWDRMEEGDKPPVEEEEGNKPKTLWDLFMEYTKAKEKSERSRFIDAVDSSG